VEKNKFKRNNPWRFKAEGEHSLNSPLTIRLTENQKEQIKKVPNWQGLLRDCINKLIENNIDCT
jgi:hypothetical protein